MNNNSTIFRDKRPLLVFLIPAGIFMAVFLFYPFVMNFVNSFQQIGNLGAAAKGWNGPWYTNYLLLFTDKQMHTALLNTLLVMVCTVVFQVGVALLLALLVDSIHRGAQFFRTVYFFPIVISATALGLLFNLVFLYDKGMLNQLRELFGATDLLNFKEAGLWTMFTMIAPVMWQYVGFYFVILVTGLNNIDPELYEAAAIDGATGLQRVKRITLPLLRNVICTCVVLAVTGSLKVFDLPWTMFPNGMPSGRTWLTGTYMYYQAFQTNNVDYAATIAVLIVVLGVVISQIVNRVFKEKPM